MPLNCFTCGDEFPNMLALARHRKKEHPEESKKARGAIPSKGWEYIEFLERKGLLHHCDNGGTGILDEREQMTDEGIIFRSTCNTCYAVTKERFQSWTPDAKDRYQEIKGRKPVSVSPPPILKIL